MDKSDFWVLDVIRGFKWFKHIQTNQLIPTETFSFKEIQFISRKHQKCEMSWNGKNMIFFQMMASNPSFKAETGSKWYNNDVGMVSWGLELREWDLVLVWCLLSLKNGDFKRWFGDGGITGQWWVFGSILRTIYEVFKSCVGCYRLRFGNWKFHVYGVWRFLVKRGNSKAIHGWA